MTPVHPTVQTTSTQKTGNRASKETYTMASPVGAVVAVAGATVPAPTLNATSPGTTTASAGSLSAGSLSAYAPNPGSAASGGGALDKDAFLKLLVAQLKYQDPMNPSSSEDFIATTAQFTVVEKLDQLTQLSATNALVSSLSTASSMVGRTISAVQNGRPLEAVVLKSRIASGQVVLDTDSGTVRLDEIVAIGPSVLAAAPPTVTAPAPTLPAPTAAAPTPADPPAPATPADPPASNPPPAADPTNLTEENQR